MRLQTFLSKLGVFICVLGVENSHLFHAKDAETFAEFGEPIQTD